MLGAAPSMRRHELGLQSCLAVGPQSCDATADAEVQLRTRERQKKHASNAACHPDRANLSKVQTRVATAQLELCKLTKPCRPAMWVRAP